MKEVSPHGNKLVTVLIPNYKTYELTKLCLRLIRKHTDLSKAEIIVIDNDSQDESTEYLRTLSWIRLIERKSVPGETGRLAHSEALDMALAQTTTPYVLSIHTDTLVKDPRWLDYLIQSFENNTQIAGVGSWKLESKPFHKQLAKDFEYIVQRAYYKLTGSDNHNICGMGDNQYYLRSHCAMYRTDTLKKYNLKFTGSDTAGKDMHLKLEELGYKMKFLESKSLLKYIEHINHATVILTALAKTSRKLNSDKQLRRVEKILEKMDYKNIMLADELDA